MKPRALTAILETALDASVEVEGKRVTGKQVMAALAVQVATTGRAVFPDGQVLEVSPKDWLDTVKWVYAQVDGPPKNEDEIAEKVDREINGFFDKIHAALGERTAAQVLAAVFGEPEPERDGADRTAEDGTAEEGAST